MAHWNEQPTLFELTAFDQFEPFRRLRPEDVSPSVTRKSDPPTPEGNVSSKEPEVFRAVSPWAFCCG